MDDTTLRILVRVGMIVVAVAALGLVTIVLRLRGASPKVDRLAPPTAVSGRLGPLLGIGVVGALVALVGQWSRGGSVSDDPSPLRLAMMIMGLAVAIGGFYAYSWLLRTGQD
jgi:hypothetical protein